MGGWDDADVELEKRLRRWALPAALGVAWLLAQTGGGRFLERIFFGMWLHELGHAATAWLLGYAAFPGPWFTPIASARSLPFALLAPALLLALAVRAWQRGRTLAAALLGLGAALLPVVTARVPADRAREAILFMGDGGCLVLATLCMLAVYAPAGSALQRGWLRWGFLAIGACAFCDVASVWWGARSDLDRIPFGENEGVGLSDPSVLSEQFGWSSWTLIHRYLALAAACLALLALAWLRGLFAEPALAEPE